VAGVVAGEIVGAVVEATAVIGGLTVAEGIVGETLITELTGGHDLRLLVAELQGIEEDFADRQLLEKSIHTYQAVVVFAEETSPVIGCLQPHCRLSVHLSLARLLRAADGR
jgi:hypothetical protein